MWPATERATNQAVTSTFVIDIRYAGRGAWEVRGDDGEQLSTHTSETEAELAARRHAEQRGAVEIIVHDCYHRSYVLPVSRFRRSG